MCTQDRPQEHTLHEPECRAIVSRPVHCLGEQLVACPSIETACRDRHVTLLFQDLQRIAPGKQNFGEYVLRALHSRRRPFKITSRTKFGHGPFAASDQVRTRDTLGLLLFGISQKWHSHLLG
jgi:hypothetical protein